MSDLTRYRTGNPHERSFSLNSLNTLELRELFNDLGPPPTRAEARRFIWGGVGYLRTGYPRTYTQSSFFAGMLHVLQSNLKSVATFRFGSFAKSEAARRGGAAGCDTPSASIAATSIVAGRPRPSASGRAWCSRRGFLGIGDVGVSGP